MLWGKDTKIINIFASDMNVLCCIGHLTNDRIITPQAEVRMTGGVAYYFSYALSRLPKVIDYTLVTKLAMADFAAVDQLRAAGITVRAIPAHDTVFFENIYGWDVNARRQRVLATCEPFTIDDLEGIHADIYHLGTLLDSDISLPLVQALRERGRIAIDAQGFLRKVVNKEVHACDWDDKAAFLKYVDIINVNEQELYALTGTMEVATGSRAIAALGPSEVIVTRGSLGSVILYNGELITIPAYAPPAVVDATGCGDTYMAGYLYCRTQGLAPAVAGRYAAAMCTIKLTHSGPFLGTDDDIRAILRNHPQE